MAFDPDKYLSEAPASPPPTAFDPDAYLAAQPTPSASVPLPRARPEEAPSMTPAIAGAPLPQERPAEAPPREAPSPFATGPVSKEEAAMLAPTFEPLADVGRSFKRGVHAARQGFEAVSGAAASRPLNDMDEIERRLAAGEKPEDIPDREDVLGTRFMTPEKRAEVRAELEGTKAEAAKGIAARQADIQQYPVPPEVEKVANAKTFREGWEAFKEAPIKVIAHLGAESLPQSAPGLVGGMVAGPIGGLAAAGGMAGFGSYATDYASEIIDGLRDAKVDLKDPKAIETAMSDPELMKRIGAKAHAHAVPVAAFDAISAGTAAHSLLPKGLTPSNAVAKQLVEIPAKAPVQAALDMTGEAAGQQFAGDEFKPGAIIAEGLGGLSQTPGEVATAAFAKPEVAGAPRRVIVDTPANAADVAAQVAAGNLEVDPAEVHGPPEMYGPPKPTNTPVTTATAGVETTSVTEGVADAYTMIFGPGGKPQMVPAAAAPAPGTFGPMGAPYAPTTPAAPAAGPNPKTDPAGFHDAALAQAETLYPTHVDQGVLSQAFINGTKNQTWDTGLPDGFPVSQAIEAYNAGQHFLDASILGYGPQAQAAPSATAKPAAFDAIDYSDPWAQSVVAQAETNFPNIGDYPSPQAYAFENGAHGLPWNMGLEADVTQESVAMAYSSGAAYAMTNGPQAQAAQRAVPTWTQGGSEADSAALSAAYTVPTHEVTRRPLTANPETNPEWTRGQENTVPGPRSSYTELMVQTPMDSSPSVTQAREEAGIRTFRKAANDNEQKLNTQPIKDALQQHFQETVTDPHKEFIRRYDELHAFGEEITKKGNWTELNVARYNKMGRDMNPDWINVEFDPLGTRTPTEEGLVTIPITVRESVNGSPVAVVEGNPAVPSEIGFFRAALWALRGGIRRIAWTGGFAPTARKLARRLGGTMGSTRVPIARPAVTQVGSTMDPTTRMLVPLWGVVDPATGKPFVTTPDRSAAEEVAEKNTTYSEVPVVTLPRSAFDVVRIGQPYTVETFSNSQGAAVGSSGSTNPLSKAVVDPLVGALNSLIKRLNLGISVKVIVHDGPIRYMQYNHDTKQMEEHVTQSLGTARSLGKTPQTKLYAYSDIVKGEIHVSLASPEHNNAESLWATMVHELGHLVMNTIYQNASNAVKTAVHEAYKQSYFNKMKLTMTMEEVYRLQSNAAFMIDRVLRGEQSTRTLGSLTQDQVDYWVGMNEWFAEQVAKWGTTAEKPLSVVEKFFAGMAKRLMAMLKVASDMFGMHYEAVPALKAFLDSAIDSDAMKLMGPQVHVQTTHETTLKNATQMEPEDAAVEQQVETQPAMDGINGVFNGRPPGEAQNAKAYADRFNWMWKIFTGIHQLAAANPHIQALAAYVETVRVAQQVKNAIMVRSQEVLEKWNNLGETQASAVSALIDDVQALNYLTPDEVKRKVSRHPTLAELTSLAQKHGVTPRGLAVYAEIGKTFQEFLTRLEDVGKTEAMKISDQTRRDLKLAGIAKQIAALRSKPYFPAMRFGSYTLTIRNAAKKVIHFETFETKRQRASAMSAIAGQYNVAPGDMQIGYMDKSARPLLGVPTALLELIGEKLELKAHQKDALEQLKYELSPAESFKHRFQHKKRVAGYSQDFRRAYANYFFHGANHLMKAKFADRLRALAKMAKEEVATEPDVTKRDKIVAQMTNHTEAWLDPKPDWSAVRSAAFLLNLAFSPAAAMQNLSQTLLTTHPFLANKFGHLNSIPALARAVRSLETFYKKRTLEKHTNFTQKALFQGMQEGIIDETQATELAAVADGDILGKGFGGNKIQRGWTKFNEWGSFMFQMAEQTNRRLVFRAALELALAHPAAKYVQESIKKHQLTYDQRRAEGWTEAEAAAYVTAVDATSETQFEYGKEFAPRIMRGRARSLLVFKTFQQSYWMFLVNNPGARYESLLIMAFLGGFLGLPWAEDLQRLLRTLGWQIFGKDFDLAHEGRKWIIELLGSNEAGDFGADVMLHGMAKRGYGIPHVMDMLAGTVGFDRSYVPTFDRSKAIAGGTFLPVELDKLFGPPLQSPEKAIAQQTQKASGAVFGYGFAAYNAMMNTQLNWNDFKRWEQMMPRAASNISKAFRAASEGGSRTNTGGQIVEYNVRDPQGAAEVIGMAMGYRPYRENYEWEEAMAKHDAAKFIDIQREQVMRQFGNAVLGKDPDERAKMTQAVRDFNANLQPEERGKAITSDSLRKSVETKARDRALQERGLPTKKGDVPIYRAEDRLYPGQNRTLRPVPGALKP